MNQEQLPSPTLERIVTAFEACGVVTEQDWMALLRRDWAVRVLDAWSVLRGTNVPNVQRNLREKQDRLWSVFTWSDSGPGWGRSEHTANSPDAARLLAADAVWSGLPESVRAEIGERP